MSDNAKIPLQIIRDTREQDGFSFVGFPCTVTPGTLATADYSLVGFTDRIGIERKSMQDLIHCLGPDRERFSRELQRLKAYDSSAVVIEQPQSVLRLGHYRSAMNAESAVIAFDALRVRSGSAITRGCRSCDVQHATMPAIDGALRLVPTMTPERTAPQAGRWHDESQPARAPPGRERSHQSASREPEPMTRQARAWSWPMQVVLVVWFSSRERIELP